MRVGVGVGIATVLALTALSAGSTVPGAADAAVARHDPPAAASLATNAAARPAVAIPKVVAVPVRSSYETPTRAISRDIGVSVALPDGHDLWIFGDTGIYNRTGSAWDFTGFVDGSTAMVAKYARGRVPRGAEVPKAKPTRFMSVPPKVYMPDRSGHLCVKPTPTAAFSARWPTGAALMPANPSRVLIPYVIVCVTHPKNKGVAQRAEGWGYALYNWKTNKFDRPPHDVFTPHTTGAAIPGSKQFGQPVFENGKVTMYAFQCTQSFIGCTAGQLWSVTISPTVPVLDNPGSYRLTEVTTDGSSAWEPLSISVGRYSDGLRLVEQNTIGGAYKIFSAPDTTTPWHLVSQGQLPGCVNKSAFCFGLEGHPELSVSGSVFVSYKDPNSGPSGHVVVSALAG